MEAKLKERPILFSGPMVLAILEGRKTMTRRVIKPQPNPPEPITDAYYDRECVMPTGGWAFGNNTGRVWSCPYGQPGDRLWIKRTFYSSNSIGLEGEDIVYGLTDNRIYGIHTGGGIEYERYHACEWDPVKTNPGFSERRLCGGIGREDLLTHEIQRIWAQGVRGVVSVKRSDDKKGIPEYFSLSQEQKDYEICTSAGLHGFSRDAPFFIIAGSASRWKPKQQQPGKSKMGNAGRELAGSRSPRPWDEGREAPSIEADRSRKMGDSLGSGEGLNEPASCGKGSWHVPGFDISYRAEKVKTRPSIFMPRWASRILLEIVNVRAEHVQDISEEDARREGCPLEWADPLNWFSNLWDFLNARPKPVYEQKRIVSYVSYPWDDIHETRTYRGKPWVVNGNPLIWVVEFKSVEA